MAYHYGTPGGSAAAGAHDGWTTSARARAGRRGEQRVAQLLAAVWKDRPDVYVFHDLDSPAGNIDHVAVAGRRIVIVDAKRWRPGHYWTAAVRTRRGWDPAPWADRPSAAADQLVRDLAAAHTASRPTDDLKVRKLLIVVPSEPGPVSLVGYRPGRGVRAAVASDPAAIRRLRRALPGGGQARGWVLRLLHARLHDPDQHVAHGRAL